MLNGIKSLTNNMILPYTKYAKMVISSKCKKKKNMLQRSCLTLKMQYFIFSKIEIHRSLMCLESHD